MSIKEKVYFGPGEKYPAELSNVPSTLESRLFKVELLSAEDLELLPEGKRWELSSSQVLEVRLARAAKQRRKDLIEAATSSASITHNPKQRFDKTFGSGSLVYEPSPSQSKSGPQEVVISHRKLLDANRLDERQGVLIESTTLYFEKGLLRQLQGYKHDGKNPVEVYRTEGGSFLVYHPHLIRKTTDGTGMEITTIFSPQKYTYTREEEAIPKRDSTEKPSRVNIVTHSDLSQEYKVTLNENGTTLNVRLEIHSEIDPGSIFVDYPHVLLTVDQIQNGKQKIAKEMSVFAVFTLGEVKGKLDFLRLKFSGSVSPSEEKTLFSDNQLARGQAILNSLPKEISFQTFFANLSANRPALVGMWGLPANM